MRPTTFKVDNTVYWTIRTYTDAGVLVDADSTPSVSVRKNGASVGDVVTVTKRAATTGIYDCSYNPAGEVEGDCFTIEETVTVSSQAYENAWSIEAQAAERGTDGASTFDHTTNQVITDAASRNASKADVSALATQASVDSIDTDVQAIASNVTMVLADTDELQQNQGDWATATTVVASNMRGTDNALLAASAPTNWSVMLINGSGEITTSNPASGGGSNHTAEDVRDLILAGDKTPIAMATGSVSNVVLVDTTTTLTNQPEQQSGSSPRAF